jgi:hypothetical protein
VSDYILPTLARMVASRMGYDVKPSIGDKMGFTRPGEQSPVRGCFDYRDEAWIEAARDLIDQAQAAGVEQLVKRHAEVRP